MRIIAGRFGGRTIKMPGGSQTRPTSDRVREAWASSVTSLHPDGFGAARVLDAFAGSGALGFEALSRDASYVTFCERDRRALEVLRVNRDSFDAEHSCTTLLAVDTFASRSGELLKRAGPYDLVFLDPPYTCDIKRIKDLVCRLVSSGALSAGALITYEHRTGSLRTGEEDFPAGLQMVSCKTYGATQLTYLRYR
jgi:16S rRNA (guanine966-N2)-methyltransferase